MNNLKLNNLGIKTGRLSTHAVPQRDGLAEVGAAR